MGFEPIKGALPRQAPMEKGGCRGRWYPLRGMDEDSELLHVVACRAGRFADGRLSGEG